MSIAKEAFETFAHTKRRVFGKSRARTVGASEVGHCIRKIGYAKHDNPQDSNRNVHQEDAWGAARRGNVFEESFFVPAMRKKYGANLLYAGKQQKTLTDGLLSATPDGLLVKQPRNTLAALMVPDIGPSGEIAIECKSIDPRIKLSDAREEHIFQAHVQLGMFRRKTKHKPDYAVIVYTNASFYDDVIEFVVKYDEKVYDQAVKRAFRILNAEHAGDLKPEGWIAGGKECEYCVFSKACKELRSPDVDVAPQAPAINVQFVEEIRDLAREERRWHTISSEATMEQRKLQDQIKDRLKEKGLRQIKCEDINVLWSSVKGRPSFDMPKLKEAAAAAGFDLQRFETVGEPSDRLTIQLVSRDRLVKGKGQA